jgi:hypothetical protein
MVHRPGHPGLHAANAGLLLHLNKLLFAHTAADGGLFKTEDNLVVDRGPAGDITVRFRSVSVADTPFYDAELVDRSNTEAAAGRHHPVLLIGVFALDLLVIHPFEDGNGRVARAVTYRTFARRAASDRADGSKQDRVRDYVLSHAPDLFRMADIRTALPGISDQTIRVVLDGLRREELIFVEGLGRSAAWRRAS